MNNTSLNAGHGYRILRDSTVIESASWQNYLNRSDYTADYYPPLNGIFMDEPNTTSATLYKLQGRKYGWDSTWGTDGCGGTANTSFL